MPKSGYLVLAAVVGLLTCFPVMCILNHMPAKCFCDYDETPDTQHNPPRVGKWGLCISALTLAFVFPALFNRFGLGLQSVMLCLFSTTLVMIALSDARYSIIPDELIIATCVFAVISQLPTAFTGDLSPVFGALVGGGSILVINLLGRLLYKKDALGMGDLKLMAVCGIACGTVGIVIAMLAGILIAALWFSLQILFKRVTSDAYLPLGPFLVAGTIFTICCQPFVDSVLAWYISII